VAGLFEPTLHEMGAVGEAILPGAVGAALQRHRLLLPTRDPARLLGVLRTLCQDLGLSPLKDPGVPEGAFATPGWVVGLFPAADHVRIEAVTSPAAAPQPSVEMLALLRREVEPAPLPRTPALHQVIHGDDLLAVHLRPWSLRGLALTQGAGNVAEAVAHVEPSMRWVLLAKGWAEIAAGYLVITPQGAQVEDAAFVLSADLHLGTVLSLTPEGAAAWQAARAGALAPLAGLPARPALFHLRAGLDLQALLSRTPLPPGLLGLDLRDLARQVQECGALCTLYAGLCTPLSWGKLLLNDPKLTRGLPVGLFAALPRALSIAVTDLRKGTPPVQGALAVGYPGGQPVDWLQHLLSRRLDRLAVQSEARSAAGQEVFAVAADAAPGQLLAPQPAPLPEGVLMEGALDLVRLRAVEVFSKRERAELVVRTDHY
jgi:hypothetical protein